MASVVCWPDNLRASPPTASVLQMSQCWHGTDIRTDGQQDGQRENIMPPQQAILCTACGEHKNPLMLVTYNVIYTTHYS